MTCLPLSDGGTVRVSLNRIDVSMRYLVWGESMTVPRNYDNAVNNGLPARGSDVPTGVTNGGLQTTAQAYNVECEESVTSVSPYVEVWRVDASTIVGASAWLRRSSTLEQNDRPFEIPLYSSWVKSGVTYYQYCGVFKGQRAVALWTKVLQTSGHTELEIIKYDAAWIGSIRMFGGRWWLYKGTSLRTDARNQQTVVVVYETTAPVPAVSSNDRHDTVVDLPELSNLQDYDPDEALGSTVKPVVYATDPTTRYPVMLPGDAPPWDQ